MNDVEVKAMAGVIDVLTAEVLRVKAERAQLRALLAEVEDRWPGPLPVNLYDRVRAASVVPKEETP